MNWNTDRHDPLDDQPIDSVSEARETVRQIMEDTHRTWREHGRWPTHPRDADDGLEDSSGLYTGTTGVVIGLRRIYQVVEPDTRLDLDSIARNALKNAKGPETRPSLLIGRAGQLLALDDPMVEELTLSVETNHDSSERELMWGWAGTILAGLAVLRDSDHSGLHRAVTHQLERLWDTWEYDDETDCHLWTQDLYGRRSKSLGAAHGAAGNVHALWQANQVLDAVLDEAELLSRTTRCFAHTAIESRDGANWPARAGGRADLVQWCHGAPGVVSALCSVPAGRSERLDELVARGAELIWNAGPLAKGHGLCHGTAGNGMTLLKVYHRTGEAKWRERAEAFALHAIRQRAALASKFNQGWYSLWTGDLGLGVFLCALLEDDSAWWGWERFL